MNFERPNIQQMTGYASGEQPDRADIIKLNTNENPYPASAAVAAALQGCRVEDLRRYPPPLADGFRRVAAAYHQLELGNIIPTNGGDELLRLIFTTFADAGQTVAFAEPSYSLYPVLAAIQGCQVVRIPLQEDWTMPGDFAAQLNLSKARIAFIVNPHAPSGLLSSVASIERIASEFNGVLVIDEAYVDFVDPALQHDAVNLVRRHDNVLILRTMSKGYSLAGLRFAYGLGAASLLAPMLYKTRDSYNTDYISQLLATAALDSHQDAAASWQSVRAERDRMTNELAALQLRCAPSQSNFLLAQVPAPAASQVRSSADGRAHSIYERLKQRGILVRYFDQPRLRDKLRITIGRPEENTQLLLCLREALQETN